MNAEASQELIDISRRYGKDPDYVLAGGGNTSYKSDDFMWVKASGHALNGISTDGFVRMRMDSLMAIWEKRYPSDPDEREKMAAADLLAARDQGEEAKRPSVESLLHSLFPHRLVIHTHPAMVNGMTCGVDGEKIMHELFGDVALWVPTVNPGYILANTVRKGYEKHGGKPGIVFLQNHGVFVAADDDRHIDRLYGEIHDSLESKIVRKPDLSDWSADDQAVRAIVDDIRSEMGDVEVAHRSCKEVAAQSAEPDMLPILKGSFSPDHIVYCGPSPAFIGSGENVRDAVERHVAKVGQRPKTFVTPESGLFAVASNRQSAEISADVLIDAFKVAVYTESFGGPQFMPADQVEFIVNWEVERYRKKISTGE